LLQDDPETGGGGGHAQLTPNQMRKLNAEPEGDLVKLPGTTTNHILFLYLLVVSAFITAICAAAQSGSTTTTEETSTDAVVDKVTCPYGDVLWGDDVFSYNGHDYQVIGGKDVAMSWKEAMFDANGRCYNGNRGYLANIGSTEENDFILLKLSTHPQWAAVQSQTSVTSRNAWIGATDMKDEGTFEWIGPGRAIQGITFYDSETSTAVDDAFTNWASGEPNANIEGEDCVEMRSAGMWNDRNCYAPNAYFVVEFGNPSTIN